MPVSTFSPLTQPSPIVASFLQARPPYEVPLSSVTAAQQEGKREIVDFNDFLSDESKDRYPSPLKDLAQRYLGLPGMINFGGGLPDPYIPSCSLSRVHG